MEENKESCPEEDSHETRPCYMGKCLPANPSFWNKSFRINSIWAVAEKNFEDKKIKWGEDWRGGCSDYKNAYKKINLDPLEKQGGKHNPGTVMMSV